ncbi:MAG: nitroreductase family protein [Planctomycetaceae bacterium]|nr:nitroreductase family protein [Planctomycetaceae bacterium]HCK40657.1 nitroreductase family protein [Planctomycetaceae bacterium]
MKILRKLMALQHEHGYLDDAMLRSLSAELQVPLYRLEGLVSFYPAFRRTPPPKHVVHVCRDVVCCMANNLPADETLNQLLANDEIEVEHVSCLGRCDCAPALVINEQPIAPRTMSHTQDVLSSLQRNNPALQDQDGEEPRAWMCDPYELADRYSTVTRLAQDLARLQETCVRELTDSGLRGMGGAGFPTGRKWDLVAQESSRQKYVICNADESEPGTFKDREILAQLSYLTIEGMVLAGLTIGAEQGIVYLRHEYSKELRLLEEAILRAREQGVLGQNAAGSGQPFDIEVFISPGGYILGEETALLEALEDKRGEPRNKPPYPGTHGLWGKPTLINNVETFALATSIVKQGAKWWHAQGREGFSGLKFVSISGDVEQPGVYEVPMGTSVAELISLAGGMRGGAQLKAFLPGGASSNFLSAQYVDTPLDFKAMQDAGSMMGTGALIVMAEDRNLYELATNLVQFFRNESCGKCVPCRIGSEKAVGILQAVQSGEGSRDALQILPDLGETLEQTSICGLGQVALNPILSMLKHFPEELPA